MPENTTTYQGRLEQLRQQIAKSGCDGFILPRTDEFQGEFIAAYAERLEWLTGFTGSAGLAIITNDKAVIMSDGRYTLQLEQQVPYDFYKRADSVANPIGQWLVENIEADAKIGYDSWLMTPAQIEKIKHHAPDMELVQIDNPVDAIWHDQPSKPKAAITIFPDEIAGKTSAQKRAEIAKNIKADAQLITTGDSICWLLNMRGKDIDFSPLIHSYALLYKDGSLDWFLDNDTSHLNLGDDVRFFKRNKIAERLKEVIIARDPKTAPIWFDQFKVTDVTDPCTHPKSIKTLQEQDVICKAHIQDGIAVTKFLKWIEETDEPMTELSVEQKLESFRREGPDYLGPSFSTIAGFAENGAIVHYRATEKTNKAIEGDSLLLIDSGGQYRWGTTDITRTIAIGAPTQEMKENYTRVLKGHICVASAKFAKGTTGKEIDDLARAPLKEAGLNYVHGTGHGVGCYLCVHEQAATIHPSGEDAIEAGMLISNEPGYYKTDEYGIRIENLILAWEEGGKLGFETVTRAPYETSLIDEQLLNEDEKQWLKQYNQETFDILKSHLSLDEVKWLQKKLFGTYTR